jgi:holo-[acyl-carrier-protein] synthase
MIVGIGCDIVEHDITKKLNWGSDLHALNRLFSGKELEIYFAKQDLQFLTGRFAAKEAFLKCLGTGMRDGIALPDIQILQLSNGKPTIDLNGEVKNISDNMGINLWHISISHSSNYSFALAIAEIV